MPHETRGLTTSQAVRYPGILHDRYVRASESTLNYVPAHGPLPILHGIFVLDHRHVDSAHRVHRARPVPLRYGVLARRGTGALYVLGCCVLAVLPAFWFVSGVGLFVVLFFCVFG